MTFNFILNQPRVNFSERIVWIVNDNHFSLFIERRFKLIVIKRIIFSIDNITITTSIPL